MEENNKTKKNKLTLLIVVGIIVGIAIGVSVYIFVVVENRNQLSHDALEREIEYIKGHGGRQF